MEIKDLYIKENSTILVHEPLSFTKENLIYITYSGDYYCSKGYEVHRTELDTYLLFWIKEGTLELETLNHNYLFTENSLFFLDCRKEHRYFTNDKVHFSWCHFDGNNSCAYYKLLSERTNQTIPSFPVNDDYKLHDLFNYFNLGHKAEHRIHSSFQNLFTNIIELYKKEMSSNEHMVHKVQAYMKDHLSEEISLDTLANSACISPYYFAHIFKQVTGTSPYEYLLQLRIAKGKNLLILSNDSIESIAEQCGFNSASHFIRAFKGRVGITPFQFRNIKF